MRWLCPLWWAYVVLDFNGSLLAKLGAICKEVALWTEVTDGDLSERPSMDEGEYEALPGKEVLCGVPQGFQPEKEPKAQPARPSEASAGARLRSTA